MVHKRNITVVGGGSIGVAFALVFARAGALVMLHEPDAHRRQQIHGDLTNRLEALDRYGLLNEAVRTIVSRVTTTPELSEAVISSELVQECIPERLELKQQLFRRLADLTSDDCIVASSTSFLPSSETSEGTGIAHRVLVAHPGNPPYALPVIELVPNPQTLAHIVDKAEAFYASAGMSPVRVHREIEGFIFNRLQGAVLREAYALVQEGIASVEDIDTVVREGVGRRWAFMGPFETADLNTRGGIAAHAQKMGPAYQRIGRERGDISAWTPDLVEEVVKQRRQILPLKDWDARVAWRDDQLIRQQVAQQPET